MVAFVRCHCHDSESCVDVYKICKHIRSYNWYCLYWRSNQPSHCRPPPALAVFAVGEKHRSCQRCCAVASDVKIKKNWLNYFLKSFSFFHISKCKIPMFSARKLHGVLQVRTRYFAGDFLHFTVELPPRGRAARCGPHPTLRHLTVLCF